MPVKVCAVTSTRADYGILTPLLKKLDADPAFDLTIIATGTHLLPSFGHTVDEIMRDGFTPTEVPIFRGEPGDTMAESCAMAESLVRFAELFLKCGFDLLLVLGDRYEIAAVCCAAVNSRLPIVHLHGGETTEGAIDECYRHAITKMSWLHFPAAEEYRRRIIQMGEDPQKVYNVGALAVENIQSAADYPLGNLSQEIGMELGGGDFAVVTFHPVTQEKGTAEEQMEALMQAMDERRDLKYLITKSNADEGGKRINELWDTYCKDRPNCNAVFSLGMRRYLSAVRNCRMVIGNSSSGILEAPVCGVPTVNIGDRQKGRLKASTVIDCIPNRAAILQAMEKADKMRKSGIIPDLLFGDGTTSEKIIRILKQELEKPICLKKHFRDLPIENVQE